MEEREREREKVKRGKIEGKGTERKTRRRTDMRSTLVRVTDTREPTADNIMAIMGRNNGCEDGQEEYKYNKKGRRERERRADGFQK